MPNKHIELVKKWLAGENVTTEELRANSVDDRANARAAEAAAEATYAAYAYAAAEVAAAGSAAGHVADLVKRYEELTNDK